MGLWSKRAAHLEINSFPANVNAGIRVVRVGTSSVRYEIGLFIDDDPEPAATGYFVHVYVNKNAKTNGNSSATLASNQRVYSLNYQMSLKTIFGGLLTVSRAWCSMVRSCFLQSSLGEKTGRKPKRTNLESLRQRKLFKVIRFLDPLCCYFISRVDHKRNHCGNLEIRLLNKSRELKGDIIAAPRGFETIEGVYE